jgi:hypothetical protein
MKNLAILLLAMVGCHHQETGLGSPTTSALCDATPRVVAQLGAVTSLARTKSFLFATAGGTLWQIDPANAAIAVGPGDAIFATDGEDIVWTAGDERALYALGNGLPVSLGVRLADFAGSYGAPLQAIASGNVMWADGTTGGGAYYALSLAGGTPIEHRLADKFTDPTAWIAGDEHMAWVTNNDLWFASAPFAQSPTQLTGVGPALLLGLGANQIYALVGGAVTAFAPDGTSNVLAQPTPPQDEATCGHAIGKYGVAAIVVADDASVYLATSSDCLNGTFATSFWRADGTRLAGYAAASHSSQFVVDDACLYYTQAGAVMAVAR